MLSLVTGASGFVGQHLVHYLKSNSKGTIVSLGISKEGASGLSHITCDLTDEVATHRALREIQPDHIYHLAGNSRVTGLTDMDEYFGKNFLTTMNLARAAEILKRPLKIFFTSSVHVYGNRSGEVDENALPKPVSHHGFTKYLAEEALRDCSTRNAQISCVVGRLYSCVGPGQPPGLVAADLSQKIAKLPKGKDATLSVGPLSGHRSFIDVRDAVSCFPRLLEAPQASRFEVYNVATNDNLEIRELLDLLLKISGKSPRVESSESFDSNKFRGLKVNIGKLKKAISEIRFRPIEESLRDMYQETLQEKSHGR